MQDCTNKQEFPPFELLITNNNWVKGYRVMQGLG